MKHYRMKNYKHLLKKIKESPSNNCVDIARTADIVFLRVFGLGNAAIAVSMRDLVEVHIENGCSQIIFDFSCCSGLDSTFMGTIMALALAAKDKKSSDKTKTDMLLPPVILSNINENAMNQITMLGLTRVPSLIYVKSEPVIFPQTSIKKIYDEPVDKDKRLQAIISAHKELMKIDSKNQEIFGPFLKAIINEIEYKITQKK